MVTGEPIPQNARNLEEFMLELKEVAELRRIEKRPIEYVFNETSFLLSCQGDWMEFGVADGNPAAPMPQNQAYIGLIYASKY